MIRTADNLDTVILLKGLPFVLGKFTFSEQVSTLFCGKVDAFIASFADSGAAQYNLNNFLKEECAVGIVRDGVSRFWHGIVTKFEQKDTNIIQEGSHLLEKTWFSFEIRPLMYLMTLRTNCRIFQNTTAGDIIDLLLSEHNIARTSDVSKVFAERIYCVQYNETDYDFMLRLMQEEGLFFIFDHTDTGHTVIIKDLHSSFALSDPSVLPYDPTEQVPGLFRAVSVQESRFVGIEGHTVKDFNYLNPTAHLLGGEASVGAQIHYTYPGNHLTQEDGDDGAAQRAAIRK